MTLTRKLIASLTLAAALTGVATAAPAGAQRNPGAPQCTKTLPASATLTSSWLAARHPRTYGCAVQFTGNPDQFCYLVARGEIVPIVLFGQERYIYRCNVR